MDDATIFIMNAKGATLEDLRHVDGKAELVNGAIVRMSAAGGLHFYASGEIFASLRAYAQRTGRGYAFGDNGGFIVDLPNRRSFSPDAGYFIGELTAQFVTGAPVFAVEIRSPDDHGPRAETRLAAKRSDYFAAGTLVVWDVDLEAGVVRIYGANAPDAPAIRTRGELADAEPAVPGWSISVDALFPKP
jgi:Uma2 family endonuclease